MSDDETCTFEDAFRTRDMSMLLKDLESDYAECFMMRMAKFWARTYNNHNLLRLINRKYWCVWDEDESHGNFWVSNDETLGVMFVLQHDSAQIDRLNEIACGRIALMRDGWINLGFLVAMTLQIDDMYAHLLPHVTFSLSDLIDVGTANSVQLVSLAKHTLACKDLAKDVGIACLRRLYQNALKLML